jgi:UPF0716 protein FxsA
MNRLKLIAWGLIALPVAEVIAFALVAHLTGFATAVMLLILVSLSGVLVLRRSAGGVGRTASSDGTRIATFSLGGFHPGRGLGGVLLVIPGFVTGILGALVMVPATRQWLWAAFSRLFVSSGRPRTPDVVDLAPGDWRELPNEAPAAAKPRKRRRTAPSRSVGTRKQGSLEP